MDHSNGSTYVLLDEQASVAHERLDSARWGWAILRDLVDPAFIDMSAALVPSVTGIGSVADYSAVECALIADQLCMTSAEEVDDAVASALSVRFLGIDEAERAQMERDTLNWLQRLVPVLRHGAEERGVRIRL